MALVAMLGGGVEVGRYNFLIIDLNPHSCPAGHCARLPDLLRDSIPGVEIDVQVTTLFPPSPTPSQPDLIVLRPSSAMLLSHVLPMLRAKWNQSSILGIFCAGWNQPRDDSESFLEGLDDFAACPFKKVDLFPRIQRVLQVKERTVAAPAGNIKSRFGLEALVGKSKTFIQALEKIPPMAESDATVLITGETGTGKELVAEAIHYRSRRQGKPFIPVNCGALPDNVFENELFGHVKGAYTDASFSEKGLVGEAEGGTIFLDEVDVLSTTAQVKLLRFLQNREYRPVGSSRTLIANVRILAATNVDLWNQVQAKQFREDVYYRLNSLSICLPPLRERTEDIPLLAAHFLARHASQSHQELIRLSPPALQKLLVNPWPGNVRELEGVIQRSVILTSNSILQSDDIDLPASTQSGVFEDSTFRHAKAQAIKQFERAYLTQVLNSHRGNITRAAKQSGKERRSFQRLLRKYGLEGQIFRKLM